MGINWFVVVIWLSCADLEACPALGQCKFFRVIKQASVLISERLDLKTKLCEVAISDRAISKLAFEPLTKIAPYFECGHDLFTFFIGKDFAKVRTLRKYAAAKIDVRINTAVQSWRTTDVLYSNTQLVGVPHCSATFIFDFPFRSFFNPRIIDIGIGAKVSDHLLLRYIRGVDCSNCGAFRLTNHLFGSDGGSLGRMQSSPQEPEAKCSYESCENRGDAHNLSPKSHTFLGFQVAYFVVFFLLACSAVIAGDRALDFGGDSFDRGDRGRGIAWFAFGSFLFFPVGMG